ncbi:hypothetical protein PG994_014703 [Apiospora phragmitis]|uniref:Uncharacterized protein n=1 Tax=Apiospora phragmitis TaxID=2905665 RepID=A0ABR1SUB8_9PEZI
MNAPRSLLVLSALGCLSLWGVAWLNGTLEALFLVQETGQFPDGRLLRKVSTGYSALDESLPVIAFFDVVTNAQAHPPRWLFFYVCGTIAAVDTWVLIESRRRGDLSLRRLIWPDPWKVTATPPGSYQALLEGCHLFTQFDVLIVGAAIVIFARHMLASSSFVLAQERERGRRETIWIVLGAALLGPAAVGSFALSVREARLRDSVKMDNKKTVVSSYKR